MKIELGKTYRTRDGHRARIYANDGSEQFPNHGAIFVNGSWDAATWADSGSTWTRSESVTDIIAEWADKPNFDPATFPKWKWAAIDASGLAYVFTNKPKPQANSWWADLDSMQLRIPTPPDWSGDWKESLVEL